MATTFAVDDVVPAETPLETRPLSARFPDVLALGGDGSAPTVDLGGLNPLMGAVHLAFSQHRGLVLSPDAIWLTIAQGVAHHLRLNADRLRDRLVRHEGRAALQVELEDDLGWDASGIARITRLMRAALAEEVGVGPTRLFTCDFSTSGEAERVASEIILLDTYSPYKDFVVICQCGIPAVTVTGTGADWASIRRRIDVIAELDLEWWTSSLGGIVDRLAEAASGKPDVDFFRRIYKPQENYIEAHVTGWIARLWPYVGEGGRFERRNPLLGYALEWEAPRPRGFQLDGPGVPASSVPAALSSCLLQPRLRRSNRRLPDVSLRGGLLGVEQDAEGRLAPIAGWYAVESSASIGAALDEIVAGHLTRPRPCDPDAGPMLYARASGVARWVDLVEGVTLRRESVDLPELDLHYVIEAPPGQSLHPRVVVAGVEHRLAVGAHLMVSDGAAVTLGAMLAGTRTWDLLDCSPADLVAFDDRLIEATLFSEGRPWRIRPRSERSLVELPISPRRSAYVVRVVDLPDGTFLAHVRRYADEGSMWWVRLRADLLEGPALESTSAEDASLIPVVARSLTEVLDRALRSGGSTDLPVLARLSDVLREEEEERSGEPERRP